MIGSTLGSYRVLEKLGEGGMGEVYRARDDRLQRDVAIKVLSRDAAGADALERFLREARAASALNHPHICTVHDIGEHAGRPFLVMELLDGRTLDARPGQVMPTGQVLRLGAQLADALAAAHARGIVHRDIKPGNIFLTARGDAKVLDFGVATLASEGGEFQTESAARPLTTPGSTIGTVAYMAPEQLRGETVDGRADLFALGLVLYEQATGHRAFTGPTSALWIDAVLNRSATRPTTFNPALPPRLEEILLKLVDTKRELRYQHAVELVADLRRLERDLDSGLRSATPASAERARDTRAVAVRPFQNMSADPDSAFFCDGLAEDLISALTRVSGLRVASRTSAFRYRDEDNLRTVADALEVGALVEGSVRRSGSRLRVTARLVKAPEGYQLWSERYDREMADVFEIQDDIVAAIVKALAPALLAQTEGVVRRPTDNPEAYELCLKARHYWHLRSPETLRVAIQLFEQAIALDPDYVLAYTGLADCHGLLRVYGWVRNEDSEPAALAAVTRAMQLDPALAETQFSRALYLFYFTRVWREAEPHFVAAMTANPRWSLAPLYYGYFLYSSYRFEEAIPYFRKALTLDPLSPFTHTLAGWTLARCGHVDEGERLIARALELQPDYIFATWVTGVLLTKKGRAAESIELVERVVKVSRSPIFLGVLGQAYGAAGRLADLVAVEEELNQRALRGEYVAPFTRVMLAAGKGSRDEAREWLLACIREQISWFMLNVAVAGTLSRVVQGDEELEGLLDQIYGGVRPRVWPVS